MTETRTRESTKPKTALEAMRARSKAQLQNKPGLKKQKVRQEKERANDDEAPSAQEKAEAPSEERKSATKAESRSTEKTPSKPKKSSVSKKAPEPESRESEPPPAPTLWTRVRRFFTGR